jgi:hypothetical protein
MLRIGGLSGLALLGGGALLKVSRTLSTPGPGMLCLTADEYAIVEKIGEAFFPGPPHSPLSALEVGLADFVDHYVSGLYTDNGGFFRLAFRAVNVDPVLSRGKSFYWLPLDERRQVLEEWASSNTMLRRGGYQSLRFLFSMGYFEDDRVRSALGFRFGCDLSGRDDPARPRGQARGRQG